jgi:HD-GYP domain-containing protein (c-di-GMP phosphodiesterase class II)
MVENLITKGAQDFYIKREDYLGAVETLYIPVQISTLKVNEPLPFDTFKILEDKSYKLVIKSNSSLTKNHVELFKDTDVKKLFINECDEKLYQEYIDKNLIELMDSKTLSLKAKSEVMIAGATFSAEKVYNNPSDDNFNSLKVVGDTLRKFIHQAPVSGAELLLKTSRNPNLYRHALNVATLGAAIYDEVCRIFASPEWSDKDLMSLQKDISDTTLSREIVILGGLLHDIGKADMKKTLDDDEEGYAEQITQGINILKEIKGISGKVIEVVEQHREYCDGTGAPKGIYKTNMSLYSQIVSLANYFDNSVTNLKHSVDETLSYIDQNASKFNQALIIILNRIIKSGEV